MRIQFSVRHLEQEQLFTVFLSLSRKQRGSGRPRIIGTGKPGRPGKIYNVLVSNAEVPEEANLVKILVQKSEKVKCWNAQTQTNGRMLPYQNRIEAHIENDT